MMNPLTRSCWRAKIDYDMNDLSRQGFVYLLENQSMPGIIKAGATRNHPLQRAKELAAGTGVPTPFTISYYRSFEDAFDAETAVHEAFSHCRVNSGREFFAAALSDMVAFVDKLAITQASQGVTGGTYTRPVELPDLSFAELFATFPDDGDGRELTAEEQSKCRALEGRMV